MSTNTEVCRRYRERNKDLIAERRKAKYASEARRTRERRSDPKTWGLIALPNIRARAKKNGHECTISASDISVPEFCPVLGIKIEFHSGRNVRKSGSNPSVDRFDNTKGYTPENVRVISLRANMLKSNATAEEMHAVLKYMEMSH